MRKIDEDRSLVFGKAAKTINFDKIVLEKLEKRARKEGTSVSAMVNMTCRRHLINDLPYYELMAKECWLKYQELKYCIGQLEAQIEVH